MNRAQKAGYAAKYQSSKTNFFGRRSKLAPSSEKAQKPGTADATTRQTVSSAGKPYFPSNGRHRHLNFLGRTSWASKDRLLVNRE
jgi:hypothetical protein